MKSVAYSTLKIALGALMIVCASLAAEAQTLKVPAGFKTSIVADNLGKARHIALTKKGDLYVKLARPVNGKGILFLKDKDGDGKYDETSGFGSYGGTGIYLKDNYLYASSDEEVFRYELDENQAVVKPESPEKIVKGLIARNQHETKSIVLDNSANIYVTIGAYSNSCQVQDRRQGSPGRPGCPILDSAGGVWQFKSDRLNQSYGEGIRYATGLRNVVGLDWNSQDKSLYVMQHGRDQLSMFPDLFSSEQSAELPSECMFKIIKNDDAGWPYIYYDHIQKKNILAPEYGGDGKKEGDTKYIKPVVGFPAHLAPNGLLFYTGEQFPAKYKNGAFIAFHGSWNRSPQAQEGYYVAFVPFKNGAPSGDWEIFAEGFAGVEVVNSPRQAQHRPCGLAQGPDGSLFVSDDVKGTIYKISYTKN
ncbi:PQQ-dependent sugar dehydrogenase [Desertivirga xinjiangensis]|uniref:PQQ-dependent sugar dehydrogenase n=1 Tax=Desertivirga xinjiangensis TaxID=539206 RepID=UPI00210ADDFB|nr:PQQ-dependent sugar dehydrogenase [Pedobacter xinjiangensis]